jgi:HlyD family secretion protein
VIRLDDTKARAELQALDAQFWDAKAREARLVAEQDDRETIALSPELDSARSTDPSTPVIIDGQQKIFDARREVMRSQAALIRDRIAQVEQEIVGLEAQQDAAAKRADIIGQEMASVTPLVQKGLERRTRILSLEREATEIEGRRGDTAAQISRAHQVIGEAQTNLLKLESDRQSEIAQSLQEARNQAFQLSERKRAVGDELERAEIRAPEDGIVTDLRIHTPGGVIGAGEALLDLVPAESRLVVTARLRPEDIDVVHPGLDAEVHLLPYNQRRVAPLNGTVSYVSADRLLDKRTDQPYYAAKIRIDDQASAGPKGIEMIPGMPVQVLIRTGRSTVALYALQPLFDSFNRSFRED